MITAQQRDLGLGLAARMTGTRLLFSSARAALRHRFVKLRSAFAIQTPASGNLIDAFISDAPTAAFAGAFLGCVTTEFFVASGFIPDIASALATVLLCGAMLITRANGRLATSFFPALYGGSFAGMTPIAWLGDNTPGAAAASSGIVSVALSIICGLVFLVVAGLDGRSADPVGRGIGGRLGAIAMMATFAFLNLVWLLGADTSRFHTVAPGAFDIEAWSTIHEFIACLVGIFGTSQVLQQRRVDGCGAVRTFVASAVALSGLAVLALGNPYNAQMMGAFYAGCFLGTSTPDRLKGWFQPVSGALVLVAVLVPVRAFLPGFGGGLGFAAFVAVVLLITFDRTAAWLTREMPMGNRSFIAALMSVMIAVFLMTGLMSAGPLAEVESNAVGTIAMESAAEWPDVTSAPLVLDKAAPSEADKPVPTSISVSNGAEDDAGPAAQPTADAATALTAGLSTNQLPHSAMADQEAAYRAYVPFGGPVAPEIRGTTRPARAAAVRPIARAQPAARQAAASPTGLQLLFGEPAIPPQPPVRRRVVGERQKPPALIRPAPAPRQDRVTAASASQ
jgi:hypothetical protein